MEGENERLLRLRITLPISCRTTSALLSYGAHAESSVANAGYNEEIELQYISVAIGAVSAEWQEHFWLFEAWIQRH